MISFKFSTDAKVTIRRDIKPSGTDWNTETETFAYSCSRESVESCFMKNVPQVKLPCVFTLQNQMDFS